MTYTVEKYGRMRSENGWRIVYKTLIETACHQCTAPISAGDLVTRAGWKTELPIKFLCGKCRPVKLAPKELNKDPLSQFIKTRDWFDNANGNVLQLLDEIADAAGYQRFYLARSWNFVRMVYFHLEKYHSKLLAARFLCLYNEVSQHFLEVKTFKTEIFDETFREN